MVNDQEVFAAKVALMDRLGITEMMDVGSLPPIARKRVLQLTRMFVYSADEVERRDEAGEKASLQQANAQALRLALRVCLDPANRAAVEAAANN